MKKGFAALDAERQREIASKGGKAAHAKGTAHQFTPEEARAAGSKGGKTHSREHLAEIGRMGARAKARNRQAQQDGEPS